MSALTRNALAPLLGLALMFGLTLAACSSGDDDDSDPDGQAQTNPLTCKAGELHPCACLGQTAMGMQTCNPTGNGYDSCTGCPAIQAGSGGKGIAGNAGTGSGGTVAGTGGAGTTAGAGGAGGTTDTKDAGAGDASMREDSSVSLPAGAEPGVSCGVGLPTLCDLETQKCCVRSLETDSCIAADAECECGKSGCTVMEARCDGPEDCADGQTCCGTLAGNGAGYDSFACSANCQSTGQQRAACHGDETPCPSGMVCANSQLLTNVQVCIDPASIDQ